MKKTIILLSCMFFVFIHAQNINAAGFWEGYSKSNVSLQEFTKRFSEIKNDAEFKTIAGSDASVYFGNYAGSKNSLTDYKKRFSEIKSNANFNNIAGSDAQIYY